MSDVGYMYYTETPVTGGDMNAKQIHDCIEMLH